MNKALAVARWEYVEKIKSKAFLVSLILLPALMIGFGVVPTFFASRPDTETKVIGARITGTPWRPARPISCSRLGPIHFTGPTRL